MTAATTYGTAYAGEWTGGDGARYRALVMVAGYGGAVTVLPVLSCASELTMGEGGGLAMLGPVAPGTCDLAFGRGAGVGRDGMTLGLGGRPDGHVAVAVQRTTTATLGVSYALADSGWTTEFAGFLLPEYVGAQTYAGLDALALRFAGGLQVSSARPFAGDGKPAGAFGDSDDPETAERFLAGFARVLQALGSADDLWAGLTTAVDVRPWVPTSAVPSTVDPVRAVGARHKAWLVGTATVSERDAVRAMARRLGARLYQSAGRWYLTSRAHLAREVSDGGTGSVTEFAYDAAAGAIDTTAQTAATRDPVVDTWGWTWVEGPTDAAGLPVRRAESLYDFRPALTNLLNNASFEEPETPGQTSDEDAAGWSMTGGGTTSAVSGPGETEARRFALVSGTSPFEPVEGDAYAAEFTDDRGTASKPVVAQGGHLRLPPNPDAVARFRSRLAWSPYSGSFDAGKQSRPAYLSFGVTYDATTRYALTPETVTASTAYTAGDRVRVTLSAGLLNGYSGKVDGTPILPAGAKVRWSANTGGDLPVMTLTRAAVVGTLELEGDLSHDLDSGGTARVYYFGEDNSKEAVEILDEVGGSGSPSTAAVDVEMEAHAVTPDGVAVEGPVVVWWEGARIDTGAADPERGCETWTVDRLEFAYLATEGGRTTPATQTGAAASVSGAAYGLEATRGEPHALGDGPVGGTDTALVVEDGGGDWVTTAWGDNTGWKVGAYSGAEASTGTPLDVLDATEAVRQGWGGGPAEGSAPARVVGALSLRDDGTAANARTLYPHQVCRHWPRTAAAGYVGSTGTEVEVYAPAAVGATLRHVAADGTETDRTVSAVARTSTGYLLTVSSAFGFALPAGQRLYISRDVWWDRYGRDYLAGTVALDASALDYYTGDVSTQTILL